MDRNHLIPFPSGDRSPEQPEQNGRTHRASEPLQSCLATGPVEYRIARTRRDLLGAFRLLQCRYLEAGLSSNHAATIRVLPHHLWEETQVFVAVRRKTVIGSLCLTRDGNRGGIPMESTYGEAINRLRKAGSRIGELGSLTVDGGRERLTGEIFGQLTRLMMFHCRYVGVDEVVCVVHPRHAKFYQKAMGFRTIGDLSRCRDVDGQPGIPILGGLTDRDRHRYRPRWRRYCFEGSICEADLRPHPMSLADKNFFTPFLRTNSRRAA